MQEINVVVTETEDSGTTVVAFNSPEQAIEWFKKLKDRGLPVSVHAVEIDSIEPFIYLEDEL